MPVLKGHEWDGALARPPWIWGDRVKVQAIKNHIKAELSRLQGLFCAYCGMRLELTSIEEIEHIAPKGPGRYPQFMFHPSNLVFSCSLCNGFEKKERPAFYNTVYTLNSDYEKCRFTIVHPYLDKPEKHYVLGVKNDGITISSLSPEGTNSIDMFKLDEEPQTSARGQHLHKYMYDFDPKYNQAYSEACARIGYNNH
jgi:uncharacterized protein (TIGR02646 family)